MEHVDAHGRHDDAVLAGLLQLVEAGGEVQAALAAEFDRVVSGLLGELPLGLEGVSGQELLLYGGLEHVGGLSGSQNSRTT